MHGRAFCKQERWSVRGRGGELETGQKSIYGIVNGLSLLEVDWSYLLSTIRLWWLLRTCFYLVQRFGIWRLLIRIFTRGKQKVLKAYQSVYMSRRISWFGLTPLMVCPQLKMPTSSWPKSHSKRMLVHQILIQVNGFGME